MTNQLTNEDIYLSLQYLKRLRELEYSKYKNDELYPRLIISKTINKLERCLNK